VLHKSVITRGDNIDWCSVYLWHLTALLFGSSNANGAIHINIEHCLAIDATRLEANTESLKERLFFDSQLAASRIQG
jgi:hypothetical protein